MDNPPDIFSESEDRPASAVPEENISVFGENKKSTARRARALRLVNIVLVVFTAVSQLVMEGAVLWPYLRSIEGLKSLLLVLLLLLNPLMIIPVLSLLLIFILAPVCGITFVTIEIRGMIRKESHRFFYPCFAANLLFLLALACSVVVYGFEKFRAPLKYFEPISLVIACAYLFVACVLLYYRKWKDENSFLSPRANAHVIIGVVLALMLALGYGALSFVFSSAIFNIQERARIRIINPASTNQPSPRDTDEWQYREMLNARRRR